MTDKLDKFIKALNPKLRKRLRTRLVELQCSPFKGKDIKKLRGFSDTTFRLRLGKIRIIYKVIDKNVEIIDIDYRGNIY